ncbi:sulfurtransferase [Cellulomonas oligotrophica]|uniref:Sulfurtransferase n=1 Tax=Cellulomonas oligotrophica TaxID=931536 RepID=A0A7Y9JXA9_9CELL|nr:sulfurtransferase [Cellulomonas oligotrophica]NYD85457.1 thiosulfate/3-mercaptopyruvate sulfurtransferase [Cellulomonas oligotrophica]GIG31534.1 sulfurtransferase [Cellulomonas oligotrophica]
MTGTTTAGPADEQTLRRGVLVDVDELAARLADDDPPLVLDVRWALGRIDGHEQHLAAHVPGAVYVDLDTELAAPPSSAAGRHPLPAVADLERCARGWGLREGAAVVVADAGGGTSAARAWWLLRWAGVRDVRLLDGGLAAWVAAGHPVEAGAVPVEPGDVVLTGGALPTVDADGAADLAARGVLLDARAVERYAGEVEPVDPRAGHVPGARSAPTTDNLGADGRFLPAEDLRARFASLGVRRGGDAVGVYCGSGVTAAHEVAALASLGVDAALYPGSWSQWSHDASRPLAVGR